MKRLFIELAYVWSLQFMIAFLAIYVIDLILLHRCPVQHLYFEECLKRWFIVFSFSGIVHLGVRPHFEKLQYPQ